MGDRMGLSRRKTLISAAAVLGAVLAFAGCGSSSSGSTSSAAVPAVQVSTANVPGLGTVLVNGQGLTLYVFVPDNHASVTCLGSCAAVWPPLAVSSGQTPIAAGGAKATLLGSDPNPDGGRVVTYAKWPLYTFTSDTSAGTALGQATNLNGGLWYVLSASGAVIRTSS